MNLDHTRELLTKELEEHAFDAYAVIVGAKGQEASLTTPSTDLDTFYDVASMGKVLVTAALILKAVGEGRMRLTDTLDAFFKHVPSEKAKIIVQ